MQKLVHADYNAIIISVHKTVVGLIYLILIELINIKCYGFDQNGFCTLEIPRFSNICDRPDNIVRASETKNDCPGGNKCWCIIIDNENYIFDGFLVVELEQTISNENLFQFAQSKSSFTYRGIIQGFNYIFVQQYSPPGAHTDITSITIRNNEICKFGGNPPPLLISKFTKNNFREPANNGSINYEYFYDCLNRIYYTNNSLKYCSTYRPEFMIEKRLTLNNRLYWCIVINNDYYLLTSANRLHIVYSSPNRNYVYYPENAYTEGEVHGSDYQLGNRRTVIAISEYNNQLANLNTITIDNQPICNYFEPYVTTTLPRTYPFMPDIPQTSPIPDIVRIPNFPATPPSDPTPNLFINMKRCGVKSSQPIPLIVSGSNTEPGDWPWHVAIYRVQLKAATPNFICSGTIINRKTIVTAAHCVVDLEQRLIVIPDRLSVELGRYDLTRESSTTHKYKIFEVKEHENFNPESYQNDIALLILANYVREIPGTIFICLPNPDEVLTGLVGTTVGWGRDNDEKLQVQLKEARFPVVNYITCLESNREFFGKYLSRSNFCAGYKNNTNVCRGDSGGGLAFERNNQWFLGGITSIGVQMNSAENQCDITQYAIFTDVTKFIPWIKQYS